MSALAQHQPQRHRSATPPRRRATLQPVTAPVPPLRQLPFVLVLAAILGVGMVGLLVLNTTLQNQSFALRAKQQEATRLAYVEAGLQAEADRLASARSLAAKATALGMRPNPGPAFLVLPDGRVVGAPKKADGTDFGSALVKSRAQLDAERRAAEQRAAAEKAAADRAAADKAAADKAAAEARKKQDQQNTGGR